MHTRTRKSQTIGYIEHTGPFDQVPFEYDFKRLYAWAKQHHLRPAMFPMAVYLDDPATTPSARLRTQVALAVRGSPAPDGGVSVRTLPAMRVLSTRHRGAASAYRATYRAIAAFAREHGLVPTGPSIETYRRPPKREKGETILTCTVEMAFSEPGQGV